MLLVQVFFSIVPAANYLTAGTDFQMTQKIYRTGIFLKKNYQLKIAKSNENK